MEYAHSSSSSDDEEETWKTPEEIQEVLDLHRSFSATLFDLHRQGLAILRALTEKKGKKALRKEPLRAIVSAIQEMCKCCVPGGLITEVKHHLDGLLFHQCSSAVDEETLRNVYYGRNVWLETYEDPEPDHASCVLSAGEDLDESDVAFLCNYCSIYRTRFHEMLDNMIESCRSEGLPLYAYRHAESSLKKVIDEHDGIIQKLYRMLESYMGENTETTV